MQQTKPRYQPSATTGFFCPFCGRAVLPSARLSYPMSAVGQFAPVYRCPCGKHVGEPIGMVRVHERNGLV